MNLSESQIKEFQEIYEKEYGKKLSWEEASEGAYNLSNLAEVLYKCAVKEHQRQLKLKENPSGFHLEGNGYTCFICKNSVSNEQTWYDKYGIKCLTCKKAVDKKIIPASIAKNEYGWYSKYDLESRFNIGRHALNRFIKSGVLKPRIIPNESGKPHEYIFLIKDNKDVLPPKKLTESQLVKEVKEDRKEWVHSEPWYKFVDPRVVLRGYKIMDYLRVTNSEKKEIANTPNEK